MNKHILAAILFVSALTFSVSRAAAQQGSQYNSMSNEILHLVNEHRAGKGLAPLKMNEVISQAAETHSRNMATKKVAFGHDGFDERIAKLSKQLKPVNASAENVAYGAKTAQEAVDMWLHSAGHTANIEGRYNLTGIGIVKGADTSPRYSCNRINRD